jgi:hypothetical protein
MNKHNNIIIIKNVFSKMLKAYYLSEKYFLKI